MFDPTLPRDFTDALAGEMRSQFTSLKALIDAGSAPTLAQVLTTGNDGAGQPMTGIGSLILGQLGVACIQMYATGGPATAITVESQGGNKALVVRAGENPGDVVGLLAIGAPLVLEGGAGGVHLRGPLVILDLPVADPHVVGAVWSDAGTLKQSAG